MILYVAVFIFVLILGTFLGYIFHRMFHQPWSGRFYKSHMVHHNLLYPPSNYISDEYRDPGSDNTVWLFAACFSPLGMLVAALAFYGVISITMAIFVVVEMSAIGFVNNSMHDAFHLRKSLWDRLWFFSRLRRLHFQHHVNQRSNFGIYSFMWDWLLNTYNKS